MMKTSILYFFLSILPFFLEAQSNQWVWMHGDNVPNQAGSYGTKGVSAPTNKPGARYEAAEWTDQQGNFWLFGGTDIWMDFSDLWKYDPSLNEWTWMHGDSIANQPGIYVTQGIPGPLNKPGARGWGVATWTDNNGNLWLFGGLGVMSTGGSLNDLWKYDIVSNEWTFVKGSNIANQAGVYGIKGVPDPNNTPGARCETSCTWVDNSGNLWLFGGQGLDAFGTLVDFNDLWMYNISTNEWTWMSGDDIGGQNGNYGIQGVPNASNEPPSRFVYSSWKDNSGNLWMFGGRRFATSDNLNDLWMYNVNTNEWTWISGSNTVNQTGTYGSKCVASASNVPPARYENRSRWIDNCGNLWLFGGRSTDHLNDLWRYNIANNEWTWVSGDNVVSQAGVYGIMGTPAPTNKPGSRNGPNGWRNADGLWLFGGYMGGMDVLNDLWKYIPNKPTADFTYSNPSSCGDSVIINFTDASTPNCDEIYSYEWDFGDPASGPDNISTLENPSHQYNSAGTYNVSLIVTNCLNAKDTLVQAITVTLQPVISLGNDTSICPGDPLTLNAGNPGASYTWSTGDTSQSISVTNAGTYSVSVTIGSCIEDDDIVVSFLPAPTVDLGPDAILCPAGSVNLDAGNPGDTYLWSTNETTQIITVQDSGYYSVEVTSNNNCSDEDSIYVRLAVPVSLGEDVSLCEQTSNTFILDAGNNNQGADFLWSTADTTQSIEVSKADIYWVEVTLGNCISRDTIEVTGNLGSSTMFFPNSFTPNKDGLNETFTGYGDEITYFKMQIFNRWGELLFETDDYTKGWDGKYKDKFVKDGVYIWVADFKSACSSNKIVHKVGHVIVNE